MVSLKERRDQVLPAPIEATPSSSAAATLDEALGFKTRRLRPQLLRWPAPPYLLLGDVAAFAASLLVMRRLELVDAAALAIMIVCFQLRGLYKSRLTLSLLDDLPSIAGGVLVASATTSWLKAAWHDAGPIHLQLAQLGALLLFVLVVRRAAYSTIRWARRTGRVRHTALILGAGHVGIRIASTMRQRPEYGLDPVGFIDSRPRTDGGFDLPAPLFGGYDQLAATISDFAVKVVVVAFGSMPESGLVDVLRTCDRLRCEIILVPRLYEVHPSTRDTDHLRGIPLVRVRRAPYRSPAWRVKRVFDVVFSVTALALLSPVLAVCALAVRCEGGPGFLFRQERVGLDGRSFDVMKFRSLKPTTEAESASTWNIAHDSRLGPVGKFLRQTSLDELPQLWNILVGDMSLVGPRPERPHFVSEFALRIPRYTWRHRVPSGLTGWAQVNGLRGDTSIEDRASFDNYYVENWSLWADVKILLRTVGQVVRRQGA